jgi:hypothetical protein
MTSLLILARAEANMGMKVCTIPGKWSSKVEFETNESGKAFIGRA